jgi:hypothetical protein
MEAEAVTPEEIRSIPLHTVTELPGGLTLTHDGTFNVLREIAAQLAEQVQQIRDDRLQRKVWRDEDQTAAKKRDEIMAGLAETQSKMGESFSPPTPIRVEFPGSVTHLGCLIREPDGSHKIATNTGELVELDGDETKFILLLLAQKKNSEAKPQ